MRAGDDARAVHLFAPNEFPPICFRTHREVMERWQQMQALALSSANEVGLAEL